MDGNENDLLRAQQGDVRANELLLEIMRLPSVEVSRHKLR